MPQQNNCQCADSSSNLVFAFAYRDAEHSLRCCVIASVLGKNEGISFTCTDIATVKVALSNCCTSTQDGITWPCKSMFGYQLMAYLQLT